MEKVIETMQRSIDNKLIERSYEIQQSPLVSTIAFISDLHFDFVNGKRADKRLHRLG